MLYAAVRRAPGVALAPAKARESLIVPTPGSTDPERVRHLWQKEKNPRGEHFVIL